MTVQERLAAPFPADVVGWKPQTVKGNRAVACAYIDARDVMDRLDEVVGVGNWSDDYTPLPDGQVMCRLTVHLPEIGTITKSDVGGESQQPDEGDRVKAAFSDALKRAAVKFGIGRYLYRLPAQWLDYDPQKKTFTQSPRLPDWAIPKPNGKAPPPPPAPPEKPKPDAQINVWIDEARSKIQNTRSMAELSAAWSGLTPEIQSHVAADKDRRKNELRAQAAA